MRRSRLIWVASIITFLLTAFLIVAAGSTPIKQAVGLPRQVSPDTQSGLSAAGSSTSPTDFTWSSAVNNNSDDLASNPSGDLSGTPSSSAAAAIAPTQAAPSYQPREAVYLADPSNYGERFSQDAAGNPINHSYIVVLHETVGSAMSAVNLFQTPHPRDEDQVSYHSLIAADGTVIYIVPPEQRAFGAGDSSFRSANGEEAVVTNAGFPPSVNNFAYHISLETPPDGRNNGATTHSGYTQAQYQSLAWLLSRTTIPDDRVTTHRAVDRSGSRIDPRSFEPERLLSLLHQYPSRLALNQ